MSSVPRTVIPEVIEPDEKLPPDLVALRRFAWLMDGAVAIPGTRVRAGLDAALGLIPGVGDSVAAVLSTWIVIGALRHRVPMRRVARMMINILVDLGLGSIPIVGDIFDFFFEENVMNLELLLRHRDRTRPPRTLAQVGVTAAIMIGIVLLFAIVFLGAIVAAVIYLIGKR